MSVQSIYEQAYKHYYGLDREETQFEFESRMWEIIHPNAMIRWEKLNGEIVLERLKSEAMDECEVKPNE